MHADFEIGSGQDSARTRRVLGMRTLRICCHAHITLSRLSVDSGVSADILMRVAAVSGSSKYQYVIPVLCHHDRHTSLLRFSLEQVPLTNLHNFSLGRDRRLSERTDLNPKGDVHLTTSKLTSQYVLRFTWTNPSDDSRCLCPIGGTLRLGTV